LKKKLTIVCQKIDIEKQSNLIMLKYISNHFIWCVTCLNQIKNKQGFSSLTQYKICNNQRILLTIVTTAITNTVMGTGWPRYKTVVPLSKTWKGVICAKQWKMCRLCILIVGVTFCKQVCIFQVLFKYIPYVSTN
jgi:hypothetical protein